MEKRASKSDNQNQERFKIQSGDMRKLSIEEFEEILRQDKMAEVEKTEKA